MQNGGFKIMAGAAMKRLMRYYPWLLVTLVCWTGCFLPSNPIAPPAAIIISPTACDFGHVFINDTAQSDFFIGNDTRDSFHVQPPELKIGTSFWIAQPGIQKAFTMPPIRVVDNLYTPASFPPISIKYASRVPGTFYDTLIFRDANDTNRILLSAPVVAQSP